MKAFVKISPTAKWFPLSQITCHQLFGFSLEQVLSIASRLGKFDDMTNTAVISRHTLLCSHPFYKELGNNPSFADYLTVVKIYDL